jgi:glycosyltransferase involved in cell wall biosynthesis
VVRNAPSAAEIGAAAGDPDHATPEPLRRKRIVYVGVINEQDHVDRAVLAAHLLAELRGRSGWEMVIAGDGECLADIKRLAHERGIEDLVSFVGWLEASDVDTLLRSGTLGIQPDIRSDMTNLSTMAKTVEYMARGLPVVAVDLLETRRTAGDAGCYGPAGTPEEFAKAIDGLLDDEDALATMRSIAMDRFASTLAWEHQAATYVRTWQRLVPVPAAPALSDLKPTARARASTKAGPSPVGADSGER